MFISSKTLATIVITPQNCNMKINLKIVLNLFVDIYIYHKL